MDTSILNPAQPSGNGDLSIDNIPRALTERRQWILWKFEPREGEGGLTKTPYQASRKKAMSNKTRTWCGLQEAVAAYREANGWFSGLGYVFSGDDPFCGIDLDGCRNAETGEIAEWAQEVIDRFGSYAEISPSKTGVKIFLIGKNPFPTGKNRKLNDVPKTAEKEPGIEVYDHGRYFAVTGWALPGLNEIKECGPALAWLQQTYFAGQQAENVSTVSPVSPSIPPGSARGAVGITNFERARRYVATMDPAISGQGGHNATFRVACKLVKGYALSQSEAMVIMREEYNPRCKPPWSEEELLHKVQEAEKEPGEVGYILTEQSSPRARTGAPVASAAVTASPNGQQAKATSELVTVRASDVQPQVTDWLWPGRIALGVLTGFIGDPKVGKSLAAIDIAARLTCGRSMPNEPDIPGMVGDVLLFSKEDGQANTVLPRLKAAGANLDRIHFFQAVRHCRNGSTWETPFNLATDLPELEAKLQELPDCRLVIIDPISSYMGKNNSNKSDDVRGVLDPLAALSAKKRVAVILVIHSPKSGGKAIHRAMGSVAFTAAARGNWLFLKDKARRLFLSSGTNLTKDVLGLAFEIAGPDAEPVVKWGPDPVDISADEALLPADTKKEDNEGTEAQAWLRNALKKGPVPALEVIAAGKVAGFSDKGLRKAFKEIGGKWKRVRFGKGGASKWHLPAP